MAMKRSTPEAIVEEGAVQPTTSNFKTLFCLDIATHVLLKEAEKGSNFVFSQLSFHSMLSLIAVGSTGSTLEQLLLFLGSKSINELNSLASQIAASVLSLAHESKDCTGAPTLSFVNCAWVDQSFRLKPSFSEVVKDVYGATAKEVDLMHKAEEVSNEINQWVEKETNGLIKNLIPKKFLGDDTALVLANALYFKGSWDRKFDPLRTESKDFHLLNGQIIQVPFMTCKRYQRHLYRSFDGYKVLNLPYQIGQDTRQFTMSFFLPDERNGLPDLIQIFKSNPDLYDKQFELHSEDIPHFWIPRFKFSFKFEASDTMKELGLECLFSTAGGLTEMVDSPDALILSHIFHKSCIEVNENGTEAAASTAPRFIKMSRRVHPPTFVADHPFIFMIKEEKSGVIFFIGAVLNPLLST